MLSCIGGDKLTALADNAMGLCADQAVPQLHVPLDVLRDERSADFRVTQTIGYMAIDPSQARCSPSPWPWQTNGCTSIRAQQDRGGFPHGPLRILETGGE